MITGDLSRSRRCRLYRGRQHATARARRVGRTAARGPARRLCGIDPPVIVFSHTTTLAESVIASSLPIRRAHSCRCRLQPMVAAATCMHCRHWHWHICVGASGLGSVGVSRAGRRGAGANRLHNECAAPSGDSNASRCRHRRRHSCEQIGGVRPSPAGVCLLVRVPLGCLRPLRSRHQRA